MHNCRSMMNLLPGQIPFFHEIKIIILQQVSQCKFRLQLFHWAVCIWREDKAMEKSIKMQSLAKQKFYKLRIRLPIICISFQNELRRYHSQTKTSVLYSGMLSSALEELLVSSMADRHCNDVTIRISLTVHSL
jgi:hypothetical protein